ncbi:MAG TPA: xylose isomerase [Planctomycetaceae bacterium]|nr:xylose isomerase [Planctomycetaceae bacterium]
MSLTRRQLLTAAAAAATSASTATSSAADTPKSLPSAPPFRFCLNTSTIRGQKLNLLQEVNLAGKVGYTGIEPWIREIDQYVRDGGSLKDLRKRITDAGLQVESAIGFAQWIVDDDKRRAAALEQAKRDMEKVRQLGGTRIAAPPAGATGQVDLDLFAAADRYRALLEVGRGIGVTPQVEVWGFSKSLSRLGETVFVAIESGHPDACVLPDIYHIYKGGSDFTGLSLLSGPAIHCFHVNDYPANPPRATITDADRVYPGDGVAPVVKVLKGIAGKGHQVALSLELFNRTYWKQDAELVCRTGLQKMKSVAARALA